MLLENLLGYSRFKSLYFGVYIYIFSLIKILVYCSGSVHGGGGGGG